ncbi:MAG: hypothetical protein Q9188_004017 [Gyalolechia gomerana]
MSAPRFVVYCTSKITPSSSCRRRSRTEAPAAPLIHPKPLRPPEPVPLAVARWERQKKDWVVNMAILALYTDIPLSAPANNPALARRVENENKPMAPKALGRRQVIVKSAVV